MKKILFVTALALMSLNGAEADAACRTSCSAYCVQWVYDLMSGRQYCAQWQYYDCRVTCDR